MEGVKNAIKKLEIAGRKVVRTEAAASAARSEYEVAHAEVQSEVAKMKTGGPLTETELDEDEAV